MLGVLLPAVTGMDYIVEKEFFLLFFHLVEVEGGFRAFPLQYAALVI